jgi:ABC-type molybdate transport system substrate-binding protein
MRRTILAAQVRIGLVLLLGHCVTAHAVEVKVIAGAAFAPALAELGIQYERATGHKLAIQYGIATQRR